MKPIIVNLFLAYLRYAARLQLGKIYPKWIIGITGSAGKSSCREAVFAILKENYRVKQSSSGNSETGLPLDILGFDVEHNYSWPFWTKVLLLTPVKLLTNWQGYDIYIAEMGVDSPEEPKNMSYLLKIIQPDIGVFLNALPVHSEYFREGESKEEVVRAIAREKGKLITSLPSEGYAVLNANDTNVISLRDKTQAKVITFGRGQHTNIKNFLLDIPGFVLTDDYGYTLAAAAAVASVFGIKLGDAKQLLKNNFQLPPGRGTLLPGINGSLIIDSSYNASRATMISSLKSLHRYPGRRKIAVLGDMRELGTLVKEEHEVVASEAVKVCDCIFTFGPLMRQYFYPKAISLGFSHKKIFPYGAMSQLIKTIKKSLKSNDVVLVKGSQNSILLETLVEAILANYEDKSKLCRRGDFWEKKRQDLFRP